MYCTYETRSQYDKKIFIPLLLIIVSVVFLVKKNSTDFFIPWEMIELTYKNETKYNIDSAEFYSVVMSKNAQGNCRVLYTQYKDRLESEVLWLINEKNDPDALIELIGRKIGNNYLDFNADKLWFIDDFNKYYKQLEKNKKTTIMYEIYKQYIARTYGSKEADILLKKYSEIR